VSVCVCLCSSPISTPTWRNTGRGGRETDALRTTSAAANNNNNEYIYIYLPPTFNSPFFAPSLRLIPQHERPHGGGYVCLGQADSLRDFLEGG
jgi:hypothetical protein